MAPPHQPVGVREARMALRRPYSHGVGQQLRDITK